MIASLLVANRGEIAVRVIRTAKEMGIRTVAVYSELDRDALHVKLADEAWNIGPAPAAESYLNMDRIIEVALESKSEAVHPGYGFLAENGAFAERVMDAGIVWVGPSPEAIRIMGDKISSRQAAHAAGAPTVPGTMEALSTAEEIKTIAGEFGYPVAIKAAHGGGGKGLRVVWSEKEVDDALEGARREASAYFGNAEVYVEKYIETPRHVEAQIILDSHGNALFLGERDCSVQRRHQKLIEETPSPRMDDEQRTALGEAAIAVARACDYQNAGTVEFLLAPNGEFYFLEMNTRLQVEHTVTEMVTGIDLVREQLRVASGEPLSVTAVSTIGHAIEFRINAEDPFANFTPSPGTITEYREPSGIGVRVDGWVGSGTKVSQYYDNLVAKLIVWATDRDQAIERGRRALQEYEVHGIATTIPAHLQVLAHEDFRSDRHHTKWIEDEVTLVDPGPVPSEVLPTEEDLERRSMTIEVGGKRFDVAYWASRGATGSGPARRKRPKLEKSSGAGSADGIIAAPMQGTIVKVSVRAGDTVEAGDPICVLEAMKMENEVTAPHSGAVTDLRVQPGDTVSPGETIAIVK